MNYNFLPELKLFWFFHIKDFCVCVCVCVCVVIKGFLTGLKCVGVTYSHALIRIFHYLLQSLLTVCGLNGQFQLILIKCTHSPEFLELQSNK